jgi:tripartite-type tricarboxylate transporter receptor subunit TctC
MTKRRGNHLIRRRRLGKALIATGAALLSARGARAQAYPTRPVRLVAPFPPGGGVDATARILADHLTAPLGQPVIVENRAGAGGAIGVDSIARAAPDGYSLVMVSPGNMTAGPAVRATPYDPLNLGFVTRVVRSPLILVSRRDLPAQDLAGLVRLLRERPDAIRYASGGVGTGTHLAAELLNLRLGTQMTHVPYRGTAPALTDLMAGNVDIFFSDTSAWPMVQQGQLRLLAISSMARWSQSPDTPSIGTEVNDFDISNWYGVVAPPGTPEPICARLAEEIAAVLTKPEVVELLRRIGMEPAPQPPTEFAAFVRREIETWATVVRAANIRAD